MQRIYLDNAATSWPKPPAVYQAVDDYQRRLGAPAGRGTYAEATEVDRHLEDLRRLIGESVDAAATDQVVFTYSGTDALNLAIRGLLRSGDHVVTTVCEHNSVLRPLRYLQERAGLQVSRVKCDSQGWVDPAAVLEQVRPETRLVAVNHGSNVTGAVQPVEVICHELAGHGAFTLIDAAQTIGHVPISVSQWRCDLLAAPGHKGLLGPTGTGILCLSRRVRPELEPLRFGGTGTSSESDWHPVESPSCYEAGNLNVAGLYGLAAGVAFVKEATVKRLGKHQRELAARLLADIERLRGVVVYGPGGGEERRLGVISLNVVGYDPQEVAVLVNQIAGIQVRAGFHCAPRMHHALGTDKLGGTVRVSFGHANTQHDVEALVKVLGQLAN